jgi:hypothetical protein
VENAAIIREGREALAAVNQRLIVAAKADMQDGASQNSQSQSHSH